LDCSKEDPIFEILCEIAQCEIVNEEIIEEDDSFTDDYSDNDGVEADDIERSPAHIYQFYDIDSKFIVSVREKNNSLISCILKSEEIADYFYLCAYAVDKEEMYPERIKFVSWIKNILSPDKKEEQSALNNLLWYIVDKIFSTLPKDIDRMCRELKFDDDNGFSVTCNDSLYIWDLMKSAVKIFVFDYKLKEIKTTYARFTVLHDNYTREESLHEILMFVGAAIDKMIKKNSKNEMILKVYQSFQNRRSSMFTQDYIKHTTPLFRISNAGGRTIPNILLHEWGNSLLVTIRKNTSLERDGNDAFINCQNKLKSADTSLSALFETAWKGIFSLEPTTAGNDELRIECQRALTGYIFHSRCGVYSKIKTDENCRAARRAKGEAAVDSTRRDGMLKVFRKNIFYLYYINAWKNRI